MFKVLMFLFVVSLSFTVQAADLTSAEEIIQRANYMSYYQGKDGRAQVIMTITDSQSRSRTRKLTILRRDESETDAL